MIEIWILTHFLNIQLFNFKTKSACEKLRGKTINPSEFTCKKSLMVDPLFEKKLLALFEPDKR